MKKIYLIAMLFSISGLASKVNAEANPLSLKGGLAAASISWVGPLTLASLRMSFGADYWFNKNVAIGADLGMGGEGYGKIVGTTTNSLVNLKTGDFVLDPGLTSTFALATENGLRPFTSLRLGFPLYSGYSPALSLTPALGLLVPFSDWVELEVAISGNVVANFSFDYLATTLTLGSLGLRFYL